LFQAGGVSVFRSVCRAFLGCDTPPDPSYRRSTRLSIFLESSGSGLQVIGRGASFKHHVDLGATAVVLQLREASRGVVDSDAQPIPSLAFSSAIPAAFQVREQSSPSNASTQVWYLGTRAGKGSESLRRNCTCGRPYEVSLSASRGCTEGRISFQRVHVFSGQPVLGPPPHRRPHLHRPHHRLPHKSQRPLPPTSCGPASPSPHWGSRLAVSIWGPSRPPSSADAPHRIPTHLQPSFSQHQPRSSKKPMSKPSPPDIEANLEVCPRWPATVVGNPPAPTQRARLPICEILRLRRI